MRAGRIVVVGLLALAAGLAVQAAGAGQQGSDTRVPVHQEPRHHLVYDSPTMRILDIQIPPGDQTLYHTHDTAILYVPIARSQTRSQDWGGEWSGGGAAPAAAAPTPATERPGRVNSVTTYVEKPHTHRVNNFGTSLFRLVGIANRTAGVDGAASATKPELENRWYRADRLVIEPGASAPVPSHAGPVVIVMQTPGTAAVDGASWHPLNGPGDIARIDGAAAHVVHNRGAGAIELMAIAVKGATP